MKNWISTETDLLPDFIIGGAMKCGTSTLHAILDKHPKIFIPREEIGFFDIDNILQHSDFNFYNNQTWTSQAMRKDPELVWKWYQEKFKGNETYIKGEDSTSYLSSRIAAERISIQKKEIKLVFLIRQPSLRTYSNYNHLLRTGRATYSFEDTIRFDPFQIVSRSLYKEQLENFYKYIPNGRIKVILFEDLIKEPELTIKEISTFIGIDYNEFPEGVLEIHSNKGKAPRNRKLHINKNLLLRSFGNRRYNNALPFKGPPVKKANSIFARIINKLHDIINPPVPVTSKIRNETKTLLDNYFYNELIGIDELVNKDITSKWFSKAIISNRTDHPAE